MHPIIRTLNRSSLNNATVQINQNNGAQNFRSQTFEEELSYLLSSSDDGTFSCILASTNRRNGGRDIRQPVTVSAETASKRHRALPSVQIGGEVNPSSPAIPTAEPIIQ